MGNPLANIVSLTITEDTVGITRAGFGLMLILSANATFPERLRLYSGTADAAADGWPTDSPEYLSIRAALSQEPRPPFVAVGRANGHKPTQRYEIHIGTVRDDHAYRVRVKGQGVTKTDVITTSGGSATNNAIVASMVSDLNDVDGKNFLAVDTDPGGSNPHYIVITATAAGDWFSMELIDGPLDLTIAQTHADPSISDELDAILLSSGGADWYGLHTFYNSGDYVEACAAWIEAQKKVYLVDVNETASITAVVTSDGSADTLDALHHLAYSRTAGSYHPDPSAMFSAAWFGRVLPTEPGEETWMFKILKGVAPVDLTDTHRQNLVDKHANSIQTVANENVTFNGMTADGDWIDVRRGLDWLDDDMSKGVFGALLRSNKVPYTDDGIAIIQNEVIGSLKRAVTRGILSSNPEPTCTVPLFKDIDPSTRAQRILPDVKFTGTLAGAVHKVNIDGVVTA